MYIPSWLAKILIFRLLENAFVKLPLPLHVLIINPPCRIALQKIFPKEFGPHLQWKTFRKISLYSIWGWGHYALAPLENNVRVYARILWQIICSYLIILILWQNRSVGWGIIFSQLKPLNSQLKSSIGVKPFHEGLFGSPALTGMVL